VLNFGQAGELVAHGFYPEWFHPSLDDQLSLSQLGEGEGVVAIYGDYSLLAILFLPIG
jgi:hypothetical protein